MPEHIEGFAGCFEATNEKNSFDPEIGSQCSSMGIYVAVLSRPKDPVTDSAQADVQKRAASPERVLITCPTAGED